MILGCDVGNGYGYISLLLNPEEDPVSLFPPQYELDNLGMPATAYIAPPDGKDIEVFRNGRPAQDRYKAHPEQLIRAVKTRLAERTITVSGIQNPVEVSRIYAAVVRDMLILAQEELRTMGKGPVYDVVFTFPAVFADNPRILETMQQSIENVTIDGHALKVRGRLPEPAAVAIDYLHYMQHIAPEDIRITDDQYTVLVYDLGYGTFDTAVVTARSTGKTPYVLHSKSGLAEVGGQNFDQVLYDELLSKLKEQYHFVPRNEVERERIRREAEYVKIKLSDKDIKAYTAEILHGDEYCDIEVTRERFEELSQHLLLQTLGLVQDNLDEAREKGIKIDGIVLSGGASQMPMVENGLKELVDGAYPIMLHRPGQAVSFGASRFAYGIGEETEAEPAWKKTNSCLEQRTDCSYGIWLPAEGKLEGEVRFLIPTGAKRPASSDTVSFSIPAASSRVIVKLYRSNGGGGNPASASPEDCESVMWFPFDVTPGAKCEVTVTVLENYAVRVDLRTDRGEMYRKTTSDMWSDLI